jgi:hypothetical protein
MIADPASLPRRPLSGVLMVLLLAGPSYAQDAVHLNNGMSPELDHQS